MKNIAVIGGGASGMLAALTAAEDRSNHVMLFEKQPRVGKKLLATGNGRCNLTNTGAVPANGTGQPETIAFKSARDFNTGSGTEYNAGTEAADTADTIYEQSGRFHGNSPEFAVPALNAFPPADVISYFRSLGLVCTEQYGGRVYPLSDNAGSVLDVLRFALESAGVEQHVEEPVTGIKRKGNRFLLRTERAVRETDSASKSCEGAENSYNSNSEKCAATGYRRSSGENRQKDSNAGNNIQSSVYTADCVIIACGGLAGGKNGGSGDGYALLKDLGHHCTKLYPALVPIRTDTDYPRSLKGVRTDAEVRLYFGEMRSSGRNNEAGSFHTNFIEETDTLENLRSMAPDATGRGELQFVEKGISGPAAFDISREASVHGGTVLIDFLRNLPESDVISLLTARRKHSPELELTALFTGILHSRLGLAVVKAAGFRPSFLIRELSDTDLLVIARTAKKFVLHVTGTDSFDAAQVTAGGIDTGEFDSRTLESRLVPGLYACGEVLDIDGDCGGFNLQWAWASGRLAGRLCSLCGVAQ